MFGLPGTHQVSPSLSLRTRETRRTQSGLLTEQGSVAPEHRLKCLPVGPATREVVVAAAVAMAAAVTVDVTTGGEVSEVDVTAAGIEDLEEVVTGMVVDAEGAEAVPPVTTTEPVAETVVVVGEAGGHLAGQPQGQLPGTGHIQGKGDKMLPQSPSNIHIIMLLFPVIRRME